MFPNPAKWKANIEFNDSTFTNLSIFLPHYVVVNNAIGMNLTTQYFVIYSANTCTFSDSLIHGQ